MLNMLRYVLGVICVAAFTAVPALGQNPTFSLEVTVVNSVPINPPVNRVVVAPGDTLEIEISLRDWSPAGEKLRGYQARIDPSGYTSGEAGSLSPIDFDLTSAVSVENKENAFIDTNNPRYIHRGKATLAIVDSISQGYGWMSVLVNRDDSPVCPTNDGTRYYCGTLKLAASDDARGVFTLALFTNPGASVLQNPESRMITPLDFETLDIEVAPDAVTPRIVSCNPPTGSIDARMSLGHDGAGRGWDRFDFVFNTAVESLNTSDFTIDDGSSNPPKIIRLVPSGRTLTLVLDRGIRAGSWTTFSHKASNTSARFGHLPGDVNGDGLLTVKDILALTGGAESSALPLHQSDIDRSGIFDLSDIHCVIDLLNMPNAYHSRLP